MKGPFWKKKKEIELEPTEVDRYIQAYRVSKKQGSLLNFSKIHQELKRYLSCCIIYTEFSKTPQLFQFLMEKKEDRTDFAGKLVIRKRPQLAKILSI